MYRGKNREENYLFKELMPFGGQLSGIPEHVPNSRIILISPNNIFILDPVKLSHKPHFADLGHRALEFLDFFVELFVKYVIFTLYI